MQTPIFQIVFKRLAAPFLISTDVQAGQRINLEFNHLGKVYGCAATLQRVNRSTVQLFARPVNLR